MNLTPRPGAGEFFVTRSDLRSQRQDPTIVLRSRKPAEQHIESRFTSLKTPAKQAAAGTGPVLDLAGTQPKFETLNHPLRPPDLHPPDETSCSSIQPP